MTTTVRDSWAVRAPVTLVMLLGAILFLGIAMISALAMWTVDPADTKAPLWWAGSIAGVVFGGAAGLGCAVMGARKLAGASLISDNAFGKIGKAAPVLAGLCAVVAVYQLFHGDGSSASATFILSTLLLNQVTPKRCPRCGHVDAPTRDTPPTRSTHTT